MTRLLIIKPSSLGDIIHGLLVAQSIREQKPECTITWVAREMFAPLVQACGTVDRTIVFPRTRWITGLGRFVSEMRAEEYDYVLDMQGLARSGLMTLLARGRVKIGRADARECAAWACGRIAPLPKMGTEAHAVQVLLEFLPLLGLKPELRGPIRIAPEPLPAPHEKLLTATRPIVLLPLSRRKHKEWPSFAELTGLLLERTSGIPVVWNSHLPCRVPDFLRGNPLFHDLTGKTTLRQAVGLIEAARLVVANDSGPMHIAAAVGTPLVVCFGPTPPERYGPYPLDRPTHRIVRAPEGNLALLTAATVSAAVEELLEFPKAYNV